MIGLDPLDPEQERYACGKTSNKLLEDNLEIRATPFSKLSSKGFFRVTSGNIGPPEREILKTIRSYKNAKSRP